MNNINLAQGRKTFASALVPSLIFVSLRIPILPATPVLTHYLLQPYDWLVLCLSIKSLLFRSARICNRMFCIVYICMLFFLLWIQKNSSACEWITHTTTRNFTSVIITLCCQTPFWSTAYRAFYYFAVVIKKKKKIVQLKDNAALWYKSKWKRIQKIILKSMALK